MGFLGELGGKRVPPYSPRAQRSALPAGGERKKWNMGNAKTSCFAPKGPPQRVPLPESE